MTRSRSQRSKLRRKYRNMLTRFAGSVQVRCFRSPLDLPLAIADMERIASRTDRRLLMGSGFVDNPETREQMAVAAEMGWLRIYVLYLEGKPAAFWRCTAYNGSLYGDHAGYDPIWRDLSPGIFLFLNIIEQFSEGDIKSIDLGYGDTQFRRCLGDLRCVESRLRIYAPTVRGFLLNVLNTATPYTTTCAKGVLQYMGCLEWARRVSRKRLANQQFIAQANVRDVH